MHQEVKGASPRKFIMHYEIEFRTGERHKDQKGKSYFLVIEVLVFSFRIQ